jgi:hypothetical protein
MAALTLRVFPSLKLFETTEEDVKFYRDLFVSLPKASSKGVWTLVE